MFSQDTIAAVATAPGEGGIAVVRISGPGAAGVLAACFKARKNPADDPLRMVYGSFVLDGRTVDMGYGVFMAGPATFTGEDTAELYCHGGSAVTALVLEAALSAGARMAQRGEFSRRAFLNGRMDLTQAEAVMDMVAARTDKAAAQALLQLKGSLGRAITAMADMLLDMIAWIEVTCDYPEEDIDQEAVDEWIERLRSLEGKLEALLKTASGGRILREGLRCALVGRPNVGKSSLLNALLREDRVIVTPVAGTTRDTVEAQVDMGGVPVTLIDTAGIREALDPVEALGIARSREALESADMALVVMDAAQGMGEEEKKLLEAIGDMPRMIVMNKADLIPEDAALPSGVIPLSAKTGQGLEALEKQLAAMTGAAAPGEATLTRSRHRDAVRRALAAVREGRQALMAGYPLDMATGSLRAAWHALGEVTGGTVDEDVIDRIFEKFCLGK
jgi:tRNA modification GTPase